jgi:hypothetical protein
MVHKMHINHDLMCNVLLNQFKPQTYFDTTKYIHPIVEGKIVL